VKAIAALLLVGVFLRHNSAHWWAEAFDANVKAIFYVFGGWWEAIVAAIIIALVWKRAAGWQIAVMACVIQISEGLQMTCQLFTASARGNVCDNLTGLPVGAAFTAIYSLFACYKWPGHAATGFVALLAGGEIFFLTKSWSMAVGVMAISFALWRHRA
jgi:hypothetical protein